MENKAKTLSRRTLMAQMLEWPAKLAGLSTILAAVPLVSTGCGETKVSGPTDPGGQRSGTSGQKADLSKDTEADADTLREDTSAEGYNGGAARGDNTPPTSTANNQPATGEGLGNNGSSGTNGPSGINGTRNTSLVQGARPNGGFFSRGAPQLTKAQIEAGQPIEATCEGTNHKLTITSEQLAQLAQGRTVQVRSATNTHFGNPTVHNHVVTYTPVRA